MTRRQYKLSLLSHSHPLSFSLLQYFLIFYYSFSFFQNYTFFVGILFYSMASLAVFFLNFPTNLPLLSPFQWQISEIMCWWTSSDDYECLKVNFVIINFEIIKNVPDPAQWKEEQVPKLLHVLFLFSFNNLCYLFPLFLSSYRRIPMIPSRLYILFSYLLLFKTCKLC
jgi:hypothetical protein